MLRRMAATLVHHAAPEVTEHHQMERTYVMSMRVRKDEVHGRVTKHADIEKKSPPHCLSAATRARLCGLPSPPSTQLCCAHRGVASPCSSCSCPSSSYARVCMWVVSTVSPLMLCHQTSTTNHFPFAFHSMHASQEQRASGSISNKHRPPPEQASGRHCIMVRPPTPS
jgi:hypothetical protein